MYSQSSITAKDTRRYWQEIRLERRKEIQRILDQCQRLRNEHKLIFDRREDRPKKEPILCRSIPSELIEEELPVVNDAIDYSDESPTILIPNKSQVVIPRGKTYQQCPSVSSVTSNEKRINRVYEPWPDNAEMTRIVGYPIVKPPIKPRKSLRFIEQIHCPPLPRKASPKLPNLLCPSSSFYSKRIQTRQWLLKNDFTSHRLPLI